VWLLTSAILVLKRLRQEDWEECKAVWATLRDLVRERGRKKFIWNLREPADSQKKKLMCNFKQL
jgi:hypothetical protein